MAHGQHEIDFRYADALKTADNIATFRFVVKYVAQQFGLIASFMPKPIFGQNGSGMHTHQSLFRGTGERVLGSKARSGSCRRRRCTTSADCCSTRADSARSRTRW